jgi:hypothetical protein
MPESTNSFPVTKPNRPKFDPVLWASWLLLTSGAGHLLVWVIAGGPWEGSTTWRKPILFGISGGLTLWSVSWVWGKLTAWRWDAALSWLLAASMLAEVFLITVQIWRGVPSHFNRDTQLDARLDDLSLLLISLAVFVLTVLTVRSLGRLGADAPTALAIRAGMAMLLVSSAMGYLISFLGYVQMDAGRSPYIYGEAGVLKFPRRSALHALQTLPLLGWVFSRLKLSVTLAQMWWWVAAHFWFLIYSVWQTVTGRLRWDADGVGLALGGSF